MKVKILNILTDDLYPTKGDFAHPRSSTTDVSPESGIIFTIIALVVIFYVVVRVWWSLRKDNAKYGTGNKRVKKNK